MLGICLPNLFFAIKETPLDLLLVYYRYKFVFSKFIGQYIVYFTESEFFLHVFK